MLTCSGLQVSPALCSPHRCFLSSLCSSAPAAGSSLRPLTTPVSHPSHPPSLLSLLHNSQSTETSAPCHFSDALLKNIEKKTLENMKKAWYDVSSQKRHLIEEEESKCNCNYFEFIGYFPPNLKLKENICSISFSKTCYSSSLFPMFDILMKQRTFQKMHILLGQWFKWTTWQCWKVIEIEEN